MRQQIGLNTGIVEQMNVVGGRDGTFGEDPERLNPNSDPPTCRPPQSEIEIPQFPNFNHTENTISNDPSTIPNIQPLVSVTS